MHEFVQDWKRKSFWGQMDLSPLTLLAACFHNFFTHRLSQTSIEVPVVKQVHLSYCDTELTEISDIYASRTLPHVAAHASQSLQFLSGGVAPGYRAAAVSKPTAPMPFPSTELYKKWSPCNPFPVSEGTNHAIIIVFVKKLNSFQWEHKNKLAYNSGRLTIKGHRTKAHKLMQQITIKAARLKKTCNTN